MAMRMQEYAVQADYAHIRKYGDADENLFHIIQHIVAQNDFLQIGSKFGYQTWTQNVAEEVRHISKLMQLLRIVAHRCAMENIGEWPTLQGKLSDSSTP